jgi:excisionase family DNA binding protein
MHYEDRWVDFKQAGRHANASVQTLRRAAKKGALRAIKLNAGRLWRTRLSWVEQWLEEGATDGRR